MAISHVFSNAIPDGTNTNIVRPSDWNSAHNQYYTLSGNTLGVSTVSGTNVVFEGAGNVSLSGTGQTIVLYATGGGGSGGGVALSAGTQSVSSGTVSFANSNGISFGMSGSNQITASYTVPTQSVQTQASGNIAGTGFTSTTTAGTAIVGTLGTNGLNLGVPAYVTNAVGGGGVAIAGGTQTATSGTVNFANSNGITFGMSGSSQITASYSTSPTSNIVAGNNITLSTAGSTLTISAQAPAVGAGTQTATSGTVSFANSNGITFGMSGSNQITASYTVPTVPTSYVSNVNGSSGAISLNVGSSLSASTNGSSITFGLASNITTALQSANTNYLTSQSNQAFSASGGSSTFQTLNFANSNGVTFSNSGGSVVASYTVPTVPTAYVSSVNGSSGAISLNVGSSLSASTNGSSITFGLASNITTALQSTGNYLTTARASNDAVGLNTAATNVTWTVNSSGISLNAGGYAGTNTSANNASLTLNSNGLTISVAAPGGGGAGNFNLSGATSGNTTASGSTINLSGINITLSGTNGSQIAISAPATSSLSAGNNFSISTNGSTIGFSARAVAAAAGTQTATSGTVNFANSNGITFGMSGSSQITASHNGITTQTVQTQASGNIAGIGFTSTTVTGTAVQGTLSTNGLSLAVPAYLTAAVGGGGIAAAAGTQTATSGTVNFANSNGITFGMSGSSQITASYTVPAVPTAYVSSVNGSSGAISLNVGSSLSSSTAGSSITFGLASNITTALQSANANYLTSQSNQAFSASGGSSTFQTLNFANSNGVTFSNSGGSVVASYTVPATTGLAGTGFTSTTTAGTAITAALGTNGLSMAVPAYLTAAAGGNFSGGVSNLGNTAGSTGITGTRIVFVGTNNISLSQSTDANGATISINQTGGGGGLTNINVSAGTTSNNLSNIVFSNGNGVTFGLDGSTVTASVAVGGGVIESGYSPHGDYPLVVGQIGQGTLALDPDIFPDLTMNMVAMPINFSNAANSTGSFTISNWLGLYTRNVSTISLAHSTSFTTGITFSGSANSSLYQGWRNITFPWSTSVSGGRYWIGQIMRTTTGGVNCSFSQYLASQVNTNFLGNFGAATNTSAQLTLGQGFYSASTTVLPASIAFTQIQGTNSLAQRFPMVAFGYNTV